MPVFPRLAGGLYLLIIACGLTAELVLRAPLRADGVAPGDVTVLRLSIVADLVMALADVAVALLLFALLSVRGLWLAAVASVFRLLQAAGILAGLGWLVAAVETPGNAAVYLAVHGTLYDLSLAFFAVTCVATGALLWRVFRLLGMALVASGAIYAIGSVLRILGPGMADAFAVAYLLPMLAELSFAVWLLLGARGLRRK